MHAFFNRGDMEDEQSAKLKELAAELLTERKTNVYYGLAFDKALKMGTGLETAMFEPRYKLKPLAPNEKRFRRQVDTPVLGLQQRSCIENLETGELRLEYPVETVGGQIYEPALYSCIDRASVGRPVMDFLFLGDIQLRGINNFDVWHIVEGATKKAYVRIGLHYKKLEGMVCYRCFGGPFASRSFWGQAVACGKEFFAMYGPDNEIFQLCKPFLCIDRKIPMVVQEEAGFDEKLWKECPASKFMSGIGFQPTLGRWGEFEEKHDDNKEDRAIILMVLIRMGIVKGWWPIIESSPLYNVLNALIAEDCLDDLMPIFC